MVPSSSGILDCEQLLQTAKTEAEKLELAITNTIIKSSDSSLPDHIYKLLHDEHTRLCELRKMKELQISKLLDNILYQSQQQASFRTLKPVVGRPTRKRGRSLGEGDHDNLPPSPVKPDSVASKEATALGKPDCEVDKEAEPPAKPFTNLKINWTPPSTFKGPFTFGNKDPPAGSTVTLEASPELPYWQRPRLGVGFD